MEYGQQNNNAYNDKAYAIKAQVNSQDACAPKPPIAERAIRELAARMESIYGLTMRIAGIADRIHGPEPTSGATAAPQPQPQALTDKFSALYSAAAEIEMSLRNQVERLENFV